MQFKRTIKRFFSAPTAKGLGGARRGAMMLLATLLLTLTAQTAWAAEWPSYITDVVLVGGTEIQAQDAKSGYSGYTWCSQKMNEGSGADIIYIGYKTGNSANTNGGYITDFIVIDAGTGNDGHNPPSSLTFQERTYYLCPAAGGDYFVNSNHGNLTSQAANGWNMYLYYTRDHFSDKRAVSSITINGTQSGAINCYYKDGTLHEKEISLNKGVSGTPFVYMHISTVTKVNRPNPEPTTNSGLIYNGSPQKLIPSNYANNNSGDVYFRLGTTGSYTDEVNSITATNAGTYTIYYYSAESYYGNSSVDYAHTMTATIAKAANSGAYVTCSNYLEGTASEPELKGTNLSSGTVTFKYSTSQNGSYSTTKPTAAGTYWVKATIASDGNYNEYTTAATSFTINKDWSLHNSGRADDPYVISTNTELDLLSERVNAGNDYQGKFFKLGADLTYTRATANNFTPIGTENHPFRGTFDGNYNDVAHTISGINISLGSTDYVGLFGYTSGADIKSLKLTNSTITGKDKVGGITGYAGSGTKIADCLVTNDVNVSGNNYVGGINGEAGSVEGCCSGATVGGRKFVGGITGHITVNQAIKNCLYTGNSITGTQACGAIVGINNPWEDNYGDMQSNYYTADLACKGANGYDINGARKAVTITTSTAGLTYQPTTSDGFYAHDYTVSKIYTYDSSTAIDFSDANGAHTYAGAGESVNLNITYTSPYEGFSLTGYTDGNGNALTHVSGNTWKLTMPATTVYITPDGSDLWGENGDDRDGTTADNAFRITTPEGLNLLAKKVNGTDGYTAKNFSGKFFELGDDITYDGSENNYTAIGTYDFNIIDNHPFSGIFDGKGHTVSGINIKKTGTGSADKNQGIFGYIDGATVKNVTLTNSTITAYNNTGGIVGYSFPGTVENCHVTSTVTIQGVQSDVTTLGGIVGSSQNFSTTEPTISGCTSAATVTGNSEIGGIVGSNFNGTVKNCLVLGASVSGSSYVGAIVGYKNSGTFTNNRYIGNAVGGVGTAADTGSDIDGEATVAYAFPTDIDNFATIVGTAADTYGTGDYQGITAYKLNDTYTALAYKGQLYYPSLWTGTGADGNPYVIYTPEGLDKLASDVNGGISTYSGEYFALGHDITYNGTENNYTPIGTSASTPFRGRFDGKGHTVSGINVNSTNDYVGLFSHFYGSYVKNLTVASSTFTGNQYVGAIAGETTSSSEIIENCVVASDVTVTASKYAGGITGQLGTIRGCISAATVSATSYVGGITACNGQATISNCLYLGTSVTGGGNGAIVGYKPYGSVVNNYYTAYGLGGVNGNDTDGARFAVSSTTQPDEATIGTAGTAYAEGETYEGITPYTNGLLYNGRYYWHEDLETIELADRGTNGGIISSNNGLTRNVKLKDRTLYKDGKWNTICLPFDVDMTDPACPLYGATFRTVTAASISGTTLNLTFAEKRYYSWDDNTLRRGVPYIIKWDKAADYVGNESQYDITNPVFTNVTVKNVGIDYYNADDYVNSTVAFRGTYDAETGLPAYYADGSHNGLNKPMDVLLLGGDNKLHYAVSGASLGACRAFFLVDPAAVDPTSPNAARLTGFNIDFGDNENEASGIISIDNGQWKIDNSAAAGWYTIDGRKLDGQPTKKGLYIHGGHKVVVK